MCSVLSVFQMLFLGLLICNQQVLIPFDENSWFGGRHPGKAFLAGDGKDLSRTLPEFKEARFWEKPLGLIANIPTELNFADKSEYRHAALGIEIQPLHDFLTYQQRTGPGFLADGRAKWFVGFPHDNAGENEMGGNEIDGQRTSHGSNNQFTGITCPACMQDDQPLQHEQAADNQAADNSDFRFWRDKGVGTAGQAEQSQDHAHDHDWPADLLDTISQCFIQQAGD